MLVLGFVAGPSISIASWLWGGREALGGILVAFWPDIARGRPRRSEQCVRGVPDAIKLKPDLNCVLV